MEKYFHNNLAFNNCIRHLLLDPESFCSLMSLDGAYDEVSIEQAQKVMAGLEPVPDGWFFFIRDQYDHAAQVIGAVVEPMFSGGRLCWDKIKQCLPKELFPYAAAVVSLELPGDSRVTFDPSLLTH